MKSSPPRKYTLRCGLWLFAVLLACFAWSLEAHPQDVIVMKNGDRITGDIDRLENGLLFVDLQYVSGKTIGVDWLEVERLETTARWRVGLKDGTLLTGLIDKVPAREAPGEDFRVEEAGSRARVAADEVVALSSQERNFWRQLSGSIDLGQSYTSGNGQAQLNLNAGVTYLSTKYLVMGKFGSSISSQPGAESTNRYNVNVIGGRFLSRNDLVFGLADFLTSSQQSLDLRTTFGGAYGHYLKRDNRTELLPFAGLVFTAERFDPSTGLEPRQRSVEGLVGLTYKAFRINKTEWQSSLLLYPGLSDSGRLRATMDSSLVFKLPASITLKFNFWDNFDSKPPVSAKRNELGVSSTVGLTF